MRAQITAKLSFSHEWYNIQRELIDAELMSHSHYSTRASIFSFQHIQNWNRVSTREIIHVNSNGQKVSSSKHTCSSPFHCAATCQQRTHTYTNIKIKLTYLRSKMSVGLSTELNLFSVTWCHQLPVRVMGFRSQNAGGFGEGKGGSTRQLAAFLVHADDDGPLS
jgi:hypothetical protein